MGDDNQDMVSLDIDMGYLVTLPVALVGRQAVPRRRRHTRYGHNAQCYRVTR